MVLIHTHRLALVWRHIIWISPRHNDPRSGWIAAGWSEATKRDNSLFNALMAKNHMCPGSTGTCGVLELNGGEGLDGKVMTLGCSTEIISSTHTHTHTHTWARLLGALWDVRGRQMGEDMTGVYRDSCGRLPSSPPPTCYTSCPLELTQHLGWTPACCHTLTQPDTHTPTQIKPIITSWHRGNSSLFPFIAL